MPPGQLDEKSGRRVRNLETARRVLVGRNGVVTVLLWVRILRLNISLK